MLSWIRHKFFKHSGVGQQHTYQPVEHNNFSSDSSMHSKSKELTKITLNIFFEGDVWVVNVFEDQVLSELLQMAISHFLNPEESHILISKYRFTKVLPTRDLNLQLSVGDEALQNEDEIIITTTATIGATEEIKFSLSPQDVKGPSRAEIAAATAHIPIKISAQAIPFLECQENFQSEIRKVLHSLVEASAKILCHSQEAKLVFDDIAARINAKTKEEVDRDAVKKLKELGFTETQARYALRLKRNRPVEALEWLLENSHRVKEDVSENDDESMQVVSTSTAGTTETDPLQTINKLLRDINEFHQRHFEPSTKALESLQEMGFSHDDAVEALRLCDNNTSAASEWLCGERDLKSIPKYNVSLDSDGPLYKALMDNPAIQMGLHNPKIMLAFLSILENPTSANLWLNDVDTAPVLGQVFKTYHSEKHIIVMKQQAELMQSK